MFIEKLMLRKKSPNSFTNITTLKPREIEIKTKERD